MVNMLRVVSGRRRGRVDKFSYRNPIHIPFCEVIPAASCRGRPMTTNNQQKNVHVVISFPEPRVNKQRLTGLRISAFTSSH